MKSTKETSAPNVAVVILNWNNTDRTLDCLKCLMASDYQDFEAIIVDNGSDKEQLDKLKHAYGKHPKVTIIENGTNLGYTKGCNIGYSAAHPDTRWGLHLDDDILFGKRWLGELIRNIEKSGAWGGTCTRMPERLSDDFGVTSITGFSGPVKDAEWKRQIETTGIIPILNATGAWFLYDKSRLGPEPYDEDFFIYADDVYLGMRVWLNGGRLVRYYSKSPDADAKHLAMHVLQKRRKQYAAMIGTRNRLLNLLYFYQPSTLLRIAPLVAISQVAYTVMTPTQLPGRIWAYLWLLTHPFFILRKRSAMQQERKVPDSVLLGQQSCVMVNETDVKWTSARIIVRICNALFLFYGRIVRLGTRDVINRRT